MLPLRDINPVQIKPVITVSLIICCFLVFLYQQDLGFHGEEQLIRRYALTPALWKEHKITAITYVFLHGGWGHLAGNMLFLWVFGNNIENAMGHLRFLLFYLMCGVVAGLTHAFAAEPEAFASAIPLIGASGAVGGTLGAYFMLYPRAKLWVLIAIIPIRMPAVVFIALWFAIQVLNLDNSHSGVAWWAHLGGFLVGAGTIPFFKYRHILLFSRRVRLPPGPWGPRDKS